MRAALCIWLMLAPATESFAGEAFLAQNGMFASRAGPTEIAVAPAPLRHETDYWCAAGDFARRALGLPGKTRLWRASPRPQRFGEAMLFTLDPQNKAEGTGFSQFGKGPRDGSVMVAMAAGNFCQPRLPFWID